MVDKIAYKNYEEEEDVIMTREGSIIDVSSNFVTFEYGEEPYRTRIFLNKEAVLSLTVNENAITYTNSETGKIDTRIPFFGYIEDSEWGDDFEYVEIRM